MGSREKYEVPDWVVDDYNSRVSAEDRLPLDTEPTKGSAGITNYSCNDEKSTKHTNQKDYKPYIIAAILLILWIIFTSQYLGIAIILSVIFWLWYFLFT